MNDPRLEAMGDTPDRNRFRQERRAAGDERFDVWLPADVAAWLREQANQHDRTAPMQIRALVRQARLIDGFDRKFVPMCDTEGL